MKTFLHYTKEKELDEAFFKNLGKRLNSAGSSIMAGARSVRGAATNTAGAVRRAGSSSIGSKILAGAKGVAVTAFKSASGERLGDAIKGGADAYRGAREKQMNKFKGKVSVAQLKLDCQKSIRDRQTEIADLRIDIGVANRRIGRLDPGTDADERDALQDRINDANAKILRLNGDEKDEMSVRYQQEKCKQVNQARTPEEAERAEGERILGAAGKIP